MKEKVKYLLQTLMFAVTSYYVIMINEQETMVPRYIRFCIAILILQVWILGLSKLPYKNVGMWIWAAVCVIGAAYVIHVKHYNTEWYGEVFHQVLRMRVFSYAILAFSIPIFAIRKFAGHGSKIKSLLFWLSLAVCVLHCIFEEGTYAYAAMFVMWLSVEADQDKHTEIADCACAGYLLTFIILFSYSLIKSPDVYVGGRYVGMFWYTAKIGEMCGFAVLSAIYFLVRLFKAKWKKAYLFIIVPALLFATFALVIVGGRSAEVGIAVTVFALFIVWNAKSNKTVLKRIGITACVVLVLTGILFAYGYHLAGKIKRGEITTDEVSYGMNHFVGFILNDHQYRIMEEGTMLNAFDILLSGRVSLWAEAVREIIPWGSTEARFFKTHNTYMYWFVCFGYIGGTIALIWFITYVITAVKRFVGGQKEALLPFICVAYMIGLMTGTNEYLCGVGLFILMMVQLPLLTEYKSLQPAETSSEPVQTELSNG